MTDEREFDDRFTVFPDIGVIELSCFSCDGHGGPNTHGSGTWAIGHHPSLDVLVDQARIHNADYHVAFGPQTYAEYLKAELDIPNWTSHEGRENSSTEFRKLCIEVDHLIREDGGWHLDPRWTGRLACLIMAQLAHVHHLAPVTPIGVRKNITHENTDEENSGSVSH